MNETKKLIDSLQSFKEACKNMDDKEGADILIRDITAMQSIAMISEELSNRVTSVRMGIFTSLSLMQFKPEIAYKLVADYTTNAILVKITGMGKVQ